MEHLTPPPPYRRNYDPPDGSRAAEWAAKLKPWQALLVGALAIWSPVATIMLAIGFKVTTPREQVGINATRIVALETAAREDRARLDRLEALTMALVQSKCLELDAGSQALTVLPCRSLGVQPRDGRLLPQSSLRRDSAHASYPAPDWDTLLPPTLRHNVARATGRES